MVYVKGPGNLAVNIHNFTSCAKAFKFDQLQHLDSRTTYDASRGLDMIRLDINGRWPLVYDHRHEHDLFFRRVNGLCRHVHLRFGFRPCVHFARSMLPRPARSSPAA